MKNCDRGLENAARGRRPRAAFSRPRSQVFTIRPDLSRKITYLFFSSLSNDFVYSRKKKTHASVTVTVVRDRKIWTALRTNQIAEFVTVTAWKKNKHKYYLHCSHTVHCKFSVSAMLHAW